MPVRDRRFRLQRRLLGAAEEAAHAFQIDIDHRRDEQRQRLRDNKPPTTAKPERPPQLGARADADRDRQGCP